MSANFFAMFNANKAQQATKNDIDSDEDKKVKTESKNKKEAKNQEVPKKKRICTKTDTTSSSDSDCDKVPATPNLNNILAKLGKKSLDVKPVSFDNKKQSTTKKQQQESSSDTDESDEEKPQLKPIWSTKFEYPSQTFKYIKPTDEALGPYSGSWVHDENQVDDKWNEENKRISKILQKLLDVEYPAQRSPKWFEMRESSITASDSGCVLGDNSHEPPYKIYVKKLLKPPFEANLMCYHGTKLEEIATNVYRYRMNARVEDFGLVKHPKYHFLAASPDGIVGITKLNGKNKTKYVGTMLEIKCPAIRKIRDDDPFYNIKYYWDQVQLQLECCDLEECDFWQNTITEYTSREQFIKDTDLEEPFRSKKTGMEKGCLIQLLPRNKMEEAIENYDNTICAYSKHLYPPKIDMSPLECDIWITDTLNNLEKSLIDEAMKKYDAMNKIIRDTINDDIDNFMSTMNKELKEEIAKGIAKNEWKFKNKHPNYVNKVKQSITEETKDKFKNDYLTNYPKKLMFPLKQKTFIKYLIEQNIPRKKYSKLVKDEQLIDKMINLDENMDFFKQTDENADLKFIKKMCELLKDLEFPKNYTFDKVFYWRFEKTLCTTVKRDREWFAEKLPVFRKTWKNIEFLRENPESAKLVFEYIDKLPTVSEDHGKPLKDNDTVQKFIDFVCNKPNETKQIEKYNKKIKELFNDIEKNKKK
jgi:putative phage-type endonuclease